MEKLNRRAWLGRVAALGAAAVTGLGAAAGARPGFISRGPGPYRCLEASRIYLKDSFLGTVVLDPTFIGKSAILEDTTMYAPRSYLLEYVYVADGDPCDLPAPAAEVV